MEVFPFRRHKFAARQTGATPQDFPRRVLVIDDSRTTRVFAKRLLQCAGASVMVCANGNEGLKTADAHSFDLVLVALHMPIMDGWETAAVLRACGARMPIIATTDGLENHRSWQMSGIDGFLRKPFTIDAVIAAWNAVRAAAKA